MWSRDAAQARAIDAQRENRRYLAGVSLPASVRVADALAAPSRGADLLVVATPTAGLRATLCAARDLGAAGPLVWLCKGFERGSGLLAHQIVAQEWPAIVAGRAVRSELRPGGRPRPADGAHRRGRRRLSARR